MSPKTPRNISGQDIIKLLKSFGYEVTRQKGNHIRLTIITANGSHHITVPDHDPLKLGTLSSILSEVTNHLKVSREELLKNI